jgi:uncharacterized cupredoxin-like copper-binding protein
LRAVTPLLASQDITAFHVIGALLALWALVVTALGVTREDFPGKGRGQAIVMAISALLVAATITAAIATSKSAPKGGEQAKASAPGTGANAGQAPGGNAGQKPGPGAPAGGTATTLLLSADPTGQLRFDKNTLQAPAGNVRITMNNPSPLTHNVSLQGPGGINLHGPTIGKGGSSQVQAQLKPGTYTYYCSVPGHRQAGMQGTLTVK